MNTGTIESPGVSTPPVDRPRKWPIAALFTLLATGLGQVYNGEWRKALVIAAIGLAILAVLLAFVHTPWCIPVVCAGLGAGVVLWAVTLVDAILGAVRRSEHYALARFNRVPLYLGLIVLSWFGPDVLKAAIRGSYVQAFRIPSEAMVQTLQVGDFLFVDRRPSARRPGRGDVITFEFPQDRSKLFIKRVVAIAGDRVEIRDKHVILNGHPVDEPFAIHIDSEVRPAGVDPRDNFGPYVVPEGHLFVMGDNRDNSNDSRYWGPLDQSLVLGTAGRIYWSWSDDRAVRWNRIGRLVR